MGDVDPRLFGKLEADVKHLSDRIERLDDRITELETAIANLTALLNKARGAWWVMAVLIATPSFVAGVATALRVWR